MTNKTYITEELRNPQRCEVSIADISNMVIERVEALKDEIAIIKPRIPYANTFRLRWKSVLVFLQRIIDLLYSLLCHHEHLQAIANLDMSLHRTRKGVSDKLLHFMSRERLCFPCL